MSTIFSRELLPRYKEEGFKGISDTLEIKRIRESKLIGEMALVEEKVISDLILILKFDITTTEPATNLRQLLIKAGLAKRHNFVSNPNSNKTRETIGFFGNALQLTLNVRQ